MDLGLSSLPPIPSRLSIMTGHCQAEMPEVPTDLSVKLTKSVVQDWEDNRKKEKTITAFDMLTILIGY